MIRVTLQAFGRRPTAWFARWGWQRGLSRLPDGCRRLDAYRILQSELGDGGAEWRAVSIASVGQYHSYRDPLFDHLPNLLQSNLRLGLKFRLFGDSGLLAALGILAPHLRQIQPPSDWQTRTPRAHRQTYCNLTVILLADFDRSTAERLLPNASPAWENRS